MATMTIRMPDEKHRRLQQLAADQGVSLNRLVDDPEVLHRPHDEGDVPLVVINGGEQEEERAEVGRPGEQKVVGHAGHTEHTPRDVRGDRHVGAPVDPAL